MSRRLTDNQDEILRRLREGEAITGPHRSPFRCGYVRPYAWPNGSSVNAMSIKAMEYGGLVKIVKVGDRHEVVPS